MPEHIWQRQCSEDEESLGSEIKSNMQKHKQKPRPKSAPLPNYDELLEKLIVFFYLSNYELISSS